MLEHIQATKSRAPWISLVVCACGAPGSKMHGRMSRPHLGFVSQDMPAASDASQTRSQWLCVVALSSSQLRKTGRCF